MPRTRNINCEINDNPTFLPCTMTAWSSRNRVTVPYRVDVCSDHVRLLWPEQQVLAAERHHPRLGGDSRRAPPDGPRAGRRRSARSGPVQQAAGPGQVSGGGGEIAVEMRHVCRDTCAGISTGAGITNNSMGGITSNSPSTLVLVLS